MIQHSLEEMEEVEEEILVEEVELNQELKVKVEVDMKVVDGDGTVEIKDALAEVAAAALQPVVLAEQVQ